MLRTCLAACLSLPLLSSLAPAAELGTPSDAVTIVRLVQEKFRHDGPAATFGAINAQGEFRDRDLYVFVYDVNGVIFAHGDNPSLVGKNRINLTDQKGNFLIREFIALVKKQVSGWIDYSWANPVSVEDKAAYVARLNDNFFAGVSVFQTAVDRTALDATE
jgi:cytochrome c